MGLKGWFYRDGRPNRVARVLDRGTAALYALGVAPDYLVALQLRGRRSGRVFTLPLVMVAVGGERYLVSMLGERANWVRNARASGDVILKHGRREKVRLDEVAPGLRAPVLKAYLNRAPNARAHLPVHKDAPLAEFERVAGRFPVFRVVRDEAGCAHRAEDRAVPAPERISDPFGPTPDTHERGPEPRPARRQQAR